MILLPYLMAGVSIAILLINRARQAVLLLVVQYFLAFAVTLTSLPIRSLIARLLGGLIVSVILYSSSQRFARGVSFPQSQSLPRSIWFRLITALIVFIVAWAIATQQFTSNSIALDQNVLLGALFNICLGCLMLGLFQSPLEAAIGLITLLVGFDLFYGGVESSLAIIILMISIQLIISLATSYVMNIAHHQVPAGEEGV